MTRLLRGTTAGRAPVPATDGGEAPERPEATAEPTADATPEAAADATPEAAPDAASDTEGAGEPGAADGDGDREPAGAGADGDGDGEVPAGPATRSFPATWRRAALAAAVAVLLLAGSAFFHAAHQLRSTPSARNTALTDAGATARVGGDVGEGLARIFSYTPANNDGVERSAGTILAGRAARQYTDLFAQVRAKLVEQRITLSTQTVRTGVIELDGNTARLLVFLDQTSRREGTGRSGAGQDKARQDKAGQDETTATSAAAQLTVTATFQGDRWLIVDIKAR
ncbi:hypothetical protein [Streptomyces sp. NBC_00691]|uniref:hypothetical protein n=1 Tax=Streptomyces sp. NBC_00691 TaxID=2903671 RepID=UPI002E2FD818|nr:hypothetical protein [Streptomyces sp. NBC_00691]